jgi:hypothetical protein
MVTYKHIFIFLIILIGFFHSPVASAQFSRASDAYSPSASVKEISFDAFINKRNVTESDPFEMKLELINAEALTTPDISVLPQGLITKGPSTSNSVSIVNGVQNKTRSWIYRITADKQGTYKIPAISIQTDAGTLYTKPFRIIVKPASDLPQNTEDKSIFIESNVENQAPYIDQPIIYNTIIYHLNPINSADLVSPKSESAIVEQITKPVNGQQILNGVRYNTIVVKYLVTPIKSGEVTLEPAILRGKTLKKIERENRPAGLGQMFDPFSILERTASLATSMEPFTIASNKVKLKVKEEEKNVNPWLVLNDLKIDDELVDVKYGKTGLEGKVGEPINLKITLTGKGKTGEALPDIESFIKTEDFKIYSDKPQTDREILNNSDNYTARIKGIKSQFFTIIPQNPGKIKFPKIEIPYWNLEKQKRDVAILEARDFVIKPGKVQNNNFSGSNSDNPRLNNVIEEPETYEGSEQPSRLVYLLGLLTLVFMAVSIYLFSRLKKKEKHSATPENKLEETALKNAEKKSSEIAITKQISESLNAAELASVIQNFANKNFALSKKSALFLVAQKISKQLRYDATRLKRLFATLDSSIYAGKEIDFDRLKASIIEEFKVIEEKLHEKNSSAKKNSDLMKLNPVGK